MKKLQKLVIIFITLLCAANVVYAACQVYYTSYVVNGRTVQCECIVCNNITECSCK